MKWTPEEIAEYLTNLGYPSNAGRNFHQNKVTVRGATIQGLRHALRRHMPDVRCTVVPYSNGYHILELPKEKDS